MSAKLRRPNGRKPAALPQPAAANRTAAPTPDAVRTRAYQRWEEAGRPAGDGVRFWLDAEQELAAK